ncbi:hypothetical protein GCM10023196_080540 [Actinoallomurus vinaceus]|uniref:Uncharacterized protein n=1 Tax=Actinoallomurus vinaceus TaxID=1080074 RepID=A0ABP8UNC0_9ACTN
MDGVEVALAELVGCPVTGIGRAAAMGVFTFGPVRDAMQDPDAGRTPTIRLHIQCSFRLVRAGKILLGSDDMNWPEDRAIDPAGAMESFRTMYDRGAKRLESALESTMFMVNDCTVGEAGMVTVQMSHGISLELFPAVSGRVESWRLVVEGGDHYVYCGG